jgi:invasion protein IalB
MISRMAAAALVVFAATSAAPAQTTPKAEKFSPRPVQPAPSPSASVLQLETVHSPWTKFCGTDRNNPQAREVCLTVKEARLATGKFIAGAALIEQADEANKLLRITLPPGVERAPGARMFIDDEAPRSGSYVTCLPNGCFADFAIDQAFIAKLKTGRNLHLQGFMPDDMVHYLLPLEDFARANEGPPTDPKAFEERRKRQ